MAKNTGGEGHGTTKPILSSDEQDQIRRAAKARQRNNRHDYQGSNSCNGNPQANGKRRKQISDTEYSRIKFRFQQARKATECPAVQRIQPGTTEFRLFEAAVLAFPTVKVPVGISRTKAAINACLPKLAGADVKNISGRNRGKQLIYRSMGWAFNELKKEEAKATADTPERELVSA